MAENVKVTQKSRLNALRLKVFNVRGVRMRHNAIHHDKMTKFATWPNTLVKHLAMANFEETK